MAIKNNIQKQNKNPNRVGLRWIFIICIIFCLFLGHAWVRTETRQSMIRVSQAQKERLNQLRYQKALSLEIDRLKSEGRIRKIAQSRLNMFTDTETNIHYLSTNTHSNGADNG